MENKQPEIYNFHSSNGTLVVNRTGKVLREESDLSDYLCNIDRVDLVELDSYLKTQGEKLENYKDYDILNVGFWSLDGVYEEPESDWREDTKKLKGE